MINCRSIIVGVLATAALSACDPEALPEPEAELELRDAALPQLVDDADESLRVPVTRAELEARGIELLGVPDGEASTEEQGEPQVAEFTLDDLDDPGLSEPMRASLELAAETDPLAAVTLYTCPDNIQANVISFGGATAGWGSVGFVGGPVSSTSTTAWFTGQSMLKCHGTRTLTPGYSEPIYVSRMSAAGAVCDEFSGGGDYWFVCRTGADTNCCSTGHGAGCEVDPVESCVCAADPYCCNTNWDSICVGEVTSLGCGSC
ncbi:MAG: hypothetical protein AB1Z98_12315 [Nannocystaceae bacterium]